MNDREQISFKLPGLPESMNSIYYINYQQKRVEMKPEVRLYKSQRKMFVPNFDVESGALLGIELELHSPKWWCANGNVRKVDAPNLFKVVVDLISEKHGYDDSQFFEFTAKKVKDEEEFVYATVYKL